MKTKSQSFCVMQKRQIIMILNLFIGSAMAGSGGTTGGADYKISIYEKLPESISIKAVYEAPEWFEDLVIGQRTCHGFISCKAYAHEYELSLMYDKSKSNGINLNLKGSNLVKGQLFEKPVLVEQKGYFENFGNVLKTEPSGFIVVNDFNLYNADSCNYSFCERGTKMRNTLDTDNIANPLSLEINADGKSISLKELKEKLKETEDLVFNQIEFADAKTLINITVLNEVVEGLLLKSIRTRFETFILDTLKQESQGVIDLGFSAIDSAGNCNLEIYEQLLSKIKTWVLGRTGWFIRHQLENQAGWVLSEDKKTEAFKIRQNAHDTLLNSVVPFCEKMNTFERGLSKLELLFKE